jgi:hypothetical protein
MGKSHAAYGLLLDAGTFAEVSSQGLLSISGVTPAIVVDGRQVTSLDFPSFHAGGMPNPRVGAALVGATLHVVHDAQTFDLAYGELLGVRTVRPAHPDDFHLWPSYPNPFNPTTKIQFSIDNRQMTIVKVFDVLGREVATLVNEVKEPGTYSVTFNGSGLASGVYFCRLASPFYAQTQKIVLVK